MTHGLHADHSIPRPTPLIDITADGHVHTRLCNHALGDLEDYVVSARNHGLQQITFLEHLEAGIHTDHRTWLRNKDFIKYFRIGEQLKKKYEGQIIINLGVEVGLNLSAINKLKQRLARYPWDSIGLSFHFYNHSNYHYNMVSQRQENLEALSRIGIDQVITDYFNGLIYGVQHLPCTKVCHLDAVLRHYPHLHFKPNHLQLIEQLLLLMQKKETALEINTSGFSIRDEPYPCKKIVRRAIQLDIPLVAGSDAHRPEQVGRFFDRLPSWLQ